MLVRRLILFLLLVLGSFFVHWKLESLEVHSSIWLKKGSNATENKRRSSGSTRLETTLSSRPVQKQEDIETLSGEDLDLSLPTEGLPQWLLDYMEWHSETLASTNIDWTRQPLLIHRCIQGDQCGGTVDRLKVLPFYLALAARTKRLFFMRWTTPLPLESFLLPTTAGLNWTVPNSLTPFLDTFNTKVEVSAVPSTNLTKRFYGGTRLPPMLKIQKAALDSNHWLVEGALQGTDLDLYRDLVLQIEPKNSSSIQREQIEAPSTYWRTLLLSLFQPTPPLKTAIQQQMNALNLTPNHYATAHIRSGYPGEPFRKTQNLDVLAKSVHHAVDCAAFLHSDGPIYVAADSLAALKAAQNYTAVVPVVSALDSNQTTSVRPLHLNFNKSPHAEAFFSIFVDLYLMSQSRCVAYGVGGFGKFGSWISHDPTCSIVHAIKGKETDCSSSGNHNRATASVIPKKKPTVKRKKVIKTTAGKKPPAKKKPAGKKPAVKKKPLRKKPVGKKKPPARKPAIRKGKQSVSHL